jgi:hypothetical protein
MTHNQAKYVQDLWSNLDDLVESEEDQTYEFLCNRLIYHNDNYIVRCVLKWIFNKTHPYEKEFIKKGIPIDKEKVYDAIVCNIEHVSVFDKDIYDKVILIYKDIEFTKLTFGHQIMFMRILALTNKLCFIAFSAIEECSRWLNSTD